MWRSCLGRFSRILCFDRRRSCSEFTYSPLLSFILKSWSIADIKTSRCLICHQIVIDAWMRLWWEPISSSRSVLGRYLHSNPAAIFHAPTRLSWMPLTRQQEVGLITNINTPRHIFKQPCSYIHDSPNIKGNMNLTPPGSKSRPFV